MQPEFKSEFVSNLYDFLQEFLKSKTGNPIFDGVIWAFRGELGSYLKSLDDHPEAVDALKARIKKLVEDKGIYQHSSYLELGKDKGTEKENGKAPTS